MPDWDDPDDPAWESLAGHGMTGDSLVKLGELTFVTDGDLPLGQRIERGISAMCEKGYVLDGPMPRAVDEDATVVVYRFVRDESARDPVTRWGARMVLIAIVVGGLLFALFVARGLYRGMD
jgi:hypothetical protein